MTLALPPADNGANADSQAEIDEALARIDRAISAIREKTRAAKAEKPPTARFPGDRRLAAQAYLQGAVAESLIAKKRPSRNGAHPKNGAAPSDEATE